MEILMKIFEFFFKDEPKGDRTVKIKNDGKMRDLKIDQKEVHYHSSHSTFVSMTGGSLKAAQVSTERQEKLFSAVVLFILSMFSTSILSVVFIGETSLLNLIISLLITLFSANSYHLLVKRITLLMNKGIYAFRNFIEKKIFGGSFEGNLYYTHLLVHATIIVTFTSLIFTLAFVK